METKSEVPSSRAQKKDLLEAWKACRKDPLPIIASNLGEASYSSDKWVIASKLLPLLLLSDSVPLVLFVKAFFIEVPTLNRKAL
jgi:hypothetical protein